MATTKPTTREAYVAKVARAVVLAKRFPRFLALRAEAAQRDLAVDRLMCCGHDQASYFFYRLDDAKAAVGGYTVRNSTTHLNPDAPRGVPSQFVRNYQEVGRAEGLDAAFAFLRTVEG